MPESNLVIIKKHLTSKEGIESFKSKLPAATGEKAEEVARRYANIIFTTIANEPKLHDCTPESILRAAGESASMDIDVDMRGLAYIVPYKNNIGTKQNPNYRKEAQLQISYLGLIDLAFRSGKVKAFSANVIYESERANVEIIRKDGHTTVEHPFSFEEPSGEIIAAYATAEVERVRPQTLVLRKDQIDHSRQCSKAPDSPAWKYHYDAMAMKTAIRQLSKFLPKSILKEFSKAVAYDEEQTFGYAQARAAKMIQAEAGSKTIDAEVVEPEGASKEPQQAEEPTGKPAFVDAKV